MLTMKVNYSRVLPPAEWGSGIRGFWARKPGEFLFAGRLDSAWSMTTRQYARLLSEWISSIGLDPNVSVPIRFVARKRRSSTVARATYERYSCSSVTERSKALFDTLASRSTMPLLSQSRLTSERLGRAPSLALPTKHVRNWGNNGSSTDEPLGRQLTQVRHLQHQFAVMQNRESLLNGTRGGSLTPHLASTIKVRVTRAESDWNSVFMTRARRCRP